MEKLFWSQFHNPERALSLADRLAEWAELNRLSGLAMKYVMSHLWPKRPVPKSYFNLVKQFLGAAPHINAMKRSPCIEGARMALARVKTYWADMEATSIATQGPAGSQDPAKHYFEQVIEGACIIEAQCLKNVMFK